MSRLLVAAALLHAFVGWRLIPSIASTPVAIALAAWLVLSMGLLPLGYAWRRRHGDRWSERVTHAGLVALGTFSTLIVLTLVRELSLAAVHVAAAWGASVDIPAWERFTATAVPLATAALTLLGYANARRRARVRTVDVPITGLPRELDGFTIAQITDLHIGPTIKHGYVAAVVDAVNGIGADMIAITGDLVDGSVDALAPHAAPLSRLSARHGTFFVTGNHEYYSGVAGWLPELRRLGMRVLLNEHVVLQHEGRALVVAGITDPSAHHFHPGHRSDPARALRGAPDDASVRVLLAHQPRSALAAAPAGYHLQLSGHTHGGQFLPWTFLVRFWQPFTAGLHRLGALWVYVSRGTGYWGPPKRLGAPSEITRLRLVAA